MEDEPRLEVLEGELTRRPCQDCGGTARRAFGETQSFRGELADYALGWTTSHDADDDRAVHLTIGIGAGNEGGGTFHAQARVTGDGEYGLVLVDRPFEVVEQGGPDLTREEALAHEDLDYVWWVADEILGRDRRAAWALHWLLGTRAFLTPPVHERRAPVLTVVHDEEGDWQLLCGTVDPEREGPAVERLHHCLDEDATLVDVLDLEPGERADRDAPGDPWVRSPA